MCTHNIHIHGQGKETSNIFAYLELCIWRYYFFYSLIPVRKTEAMRFLCQRTIIALTRRLYSIQAASSVQSPLNFLDGQRTEPLNKDGQKCELVYPATGIHYCHYKNTPIQIYWKFHHKKLKLYRQNFWYFFHISAQNIDCWYSLELPCWGSSNEYPQSMFLSRNKKNNVFPCKPQFYCIKVGFKGVKIR